MEWIRRNRDEEKTIPTVVDSMGHWMRMNNERGGKEQR